MVVSYVAIINLYIAVAIRYDLVFAYNWYDIRNT